MMEAQRASETLHYSSTPWWWRHREPLKRCTIVPLPDEGGREGPSETDCSSTPWWRRHREPLKRCTIVPLPDEGGREGPLKRWTVVPFWRGWSPEELPVPQTVPWRTSERGLLQYKLDLLKSYWSVLRRTVKRKPKREFQCVQQLHHHVSRMCRFPGYFQVRAFSSRLNDFLISRCNILRLNVDNWHWQPAYYDCSPCSAVENDWIAL
jgi:hypothetical protein